MCENTVEAGRDAFLCHLDNVGGNTHMHRPELLTLTHINIDYGVKEHIWK